MLQRHEGSVCCRNCLYNGRWMEARGEAREHMKAESDSFDGLGQAIKGAFGDEQQVDR